MIQRDGACFYFVLPEVVNTVTGQKILLIDESQVLMDLIIRTLERDGYLVRSAGSIAGAKELLMEYTPDGIILENRLPDGCGLEFCRELRSAYDIPIMFLSGDNDDELPALQSGANDFTKKPYKNDIFKARINIMLNGTYKAN